jgi:hypothetical protein
MEEISRCSYRSAKGVDSLFGTALPNKEPSPAIVTRARRAISPRYIPEIVFSNICPGISYFEF